MLYMQIMFLDCLFFIYCIHKRIAKQSNPRPIGATLHENVRKSHSQISVLIFIEEKNIILLLFDFY